MRQRFLFILSLVLFSSSLSLANNQLRDSFSAEVTLTKALSVISFQASSCKITFTSKGSAFTATRGSIFCDEITSLPVGSKVIFTGHARYLQDTETRAWSDRLYFKAYEVIYVNESGALTVGHIHSSTLPSNAPLR